MVGIFHGYSPIPYKLDEISNHGYSPIPIIIFLWLFPHSQPHLNNHMVVIIGHSHPFPSIPINSHPFPSIPIHSHSHGAPAKTPMAENSRRLILKLRRGHQVRLCQAFVPHTLIYVYIYIYTCRCVCVCVCIQLGGMYRSRIYVDVCMYIYIVYKPTSIYIYT